MGTEDGTATNKKDISDLESKIIRQVEFYFGNFNLGRDKFLREKLQNDDDGWIGLEVLVTFKRLKSLSSDIDIIATALRKSPAKIVEVNKEGTKIRRSLENPLPENTESNREEIDARSLYVKGFNQSTTLDELLNFFQTYEVENITMRRRQNHVFKGSVFATFVTKEDADKFLKIEDIKFEKKELLKELKKDYLKRKNLLFEQARERKLSKKTQTEDKKPVKEKPFILTGSLLKLSGISEGMNREDLKDSLSVHGHVFHVDFRRGNGEAIVRCDEKVVECVLEKAATENDVKVFEISSQKLQVQVIKGEEKTKYLDSVSAHIKDRYQPKQNQSRNKKGRFKKGFGKKEEESDKQKKVEEDSVKKDAMEVAEPDPDENSKLLDSIKRKASEAIITSVEPKVKKMKTEKTPAKTVKTEKTPAKTVKTEKTPAKTVKTEKTPAKTVKTPAKTNGKVKSK